MADDFAQIYVACALTNVQENWRRVLKRDCAAIVDTVQQVAGTDRWRVVAYDPITRTPPWEPGGRSFTAEEVWDIDSTKVLEEADAIVIHGFQGGSSGVGIELALALARGVPILYLHHETCDVTRLVRGLPGFVEIRAFFDHGTDERDRLREVVAEWLRTWRPVIEDGPSKRAALAQIFASVQVELLKAWQSNAPRDRAEAAAIARMTTSEVEQTLRSPMRVASLPSHKLLILGSALRVSVSGLLAPRLRSQPLSRGEERALANVKNEYEWGDDYTQIVENAARAYKERMRGRARARGLVARLGGTYDFTKPNDWVRFIEDWKSGSLA